jgi:hypothetical protein
MSLKEIFFEEKGKPSIKRITGFTLIANGLIGKNLLVLAVCFHEIKQFSDIDSSFNGLVTGGVALIFGSVADKFFKNNNLPKKYDEYV